MHNFLSFKLSRARGTRSVYYVTAASKKEAGGLGSVTWTLDIYTKRKQMEHRLTFIMNYRTQIM